MTEVCVYGVRISGSAIAVAPTKAPGEPLPHVDLAVQPFYWAEAVHGGFDATALKVAEHHTCYLRELHGNSEDGIFADLTVEFLDEDNSVASSHDMRGLVIPTTGSVYAYAR